MKKKSIIITSINSYESTSIDFFLKYDYNIIIVGDLKTPHNTYSDKDLKYIHPKDNLFGDFEKLLPYNHYCRKNIGYLLAITSGSEIIFDTDDDNYPLNNFNSWDKLLDESKTITSPKFPNIMSLFTKTDIWARGFPLELIQKQETINLHETTSNEKKNIGIIQGLAEGDPDVDAIYRLTNKNYNINIAFDKNKSFICEKNVYTQGNTQSTIWKDKSIFHLLYIPCTVSFRFCDILKMYIAQKCMWEYNKLFCYISPIVKQERNEHDYMNDFISEYTMYTSIFNIINNIFDNVKLNKDPYDLLIIYNELYKNKIVKALEIELVKEWLNVLHS